MEASARNMSVVFKLLPIDSQQFCNANDDWLHYP